MLFRSYVWNDKLRVRLRVAQLCSVERIQKGDFEIPDTKEFKGYVSTSQPVAAAPTASMSYGTNVPLLNDEDIPF